MASNAFRDRLRGAQCPSDLIDQIGGWSSGKIGEGYGEGFKLDTTRSYLEVLNL